MTYKSPGQKHPHPEDTRNLIIAVVLMFVVFVAYDTFYQKPKMERLRAEQAAAAAAMTEDPISAEDLVIKPAQVQAIESHVAPRLRRDVLADTPRVKINAPRITGSLALKGGRIDDLVLQDYFETVERSEKVHLFSPAGTEYPYYTEFGWIGSDRTTALPGKETLWKLVRGEELSPSTSVILRWENGQGQIFEREISIDENYLMTVTQRVRNTDVKAVTLYPYSLVSRHGLPPQGRKVFLVHQGYIGYIGDDLHELDYTDLKEEGQQELSGQGGWFGLTGKYWHVSLIPDQADQVTARFSYSGVGDVDRYQVDIREAPVIVAPGGIVENTVYLYAGAKQLGLLQAYEEHLNIPHFDLAIDFGVWYFITKPFFIILHFLITVLGNFALGLFVFTVCIKILLYPMAKKIFTSMYKLREDMEKVRPQLMELQKQYGHDRERLQKEIMDVYKRHNVNPVAGCQSVIWPMLIQGVIGFCLYKMLYISIEARHAAFPGWIQDMSVPDPTSITNLFGILPWDQLGFLQVGAWPVLMGLTLFLLQSQSPPPADPMQAKQMNAVKYMMPVIFAWIMAKLPVGGVIYFTWNNLITVMQQHYIKKNLGMQTRLLPGMKVHHKKEEASSDDSGDESK